LAHSIFGFQAKIFVFRAFDQVSGVSGSKVMPKIFQIRQESPSGLAGISPIHILPFFGQKWQKKSKTFPQFPQRTPNQKRKKLFSTSTRRLAESVEGLNSSLVLTADDLWPKKCESIYGLARSLKGLNLNLSSKPKP